MVQVAKDVYTMTGAGSNASFVVTDEGVLVFDSCQWDIDNLGVPDFVAKWADLFVDTENAEIDAQRYYAYNVVGKKVIDLRDKPEQSVVIDLTDPAPDAVSTEAVKP